MVSKINNKNDSEIVQPQGSLGLLALGFRGLIAWRKTRLNHKNKQNSHHDLLNTNDEKE